MQAPGEPWLTTADRERGYRRLMAAISDAAGEIGIDPELVERQLAPRLTTLAVAIAEFPGDESFVALPAARTAAIEVSGRAGGTA